MDITHDGPHAVLIQISDAYGLPDYVKQAEDVFTKEAADKLPDELFADPINRVYPIGSKADVWLSAAYFAKTASDDGYPEVLRDHIRGVIKSAAAAYGILEDVEAIMEKIETPPVEKKAEDDDSNYGDPETRMYPMFDDYGVKMAGQHFAENRHCYPPELRRRIACNILRKAAEYRLDIPDEVRREAGIGMPRIDFMSIQLVDRARRAPDEKLAETMMEFNNGLLTASMDELMKTLEKTAEVVAEFDRVTGLDTQYGQTVLAPADFLYDISPKEAQSYVDDTVQLGKYHFSVQKLAELPEEVYSRALGSDFCSRVKVAEKIDATKLADELNSLPIPDRNALLDSIQDFTV